MKDSLAITAQAIPFLNDFKNFTYLCINITYCKDNTFWTYCKKNGRTSQRIRFPIIKFKKMLKIFNYNEYQISVSNISKSVF